jgi:hypothetical protein
MKLKKQKKLSQSIRVKLPNSRSGSWDYNNLVESKLKQIIKLNS